jgi:hypothetical protein
MSANIATETFPAGKYVISDLCYVLLDDTWTELCDLMFPDGTTQTNGLFTLKDGRKMFMGGTKYGDGTYLDSLGNEYDVDSGTIGIMLESETEVTIDTEYTHVHTFDKPFTVSYASGNFSFGDIDIDTSWSQDNDRSDESDDSDWDD